MENTNQKIRALLKANALFSLSSGLALIFFNTAIANFMQIQNKLILPIIGVGLLLFVGQLMFFALKKVLLNKEVKSIIYQDLAWVIASLIIVLINPFGLSGVGLVLILIVAGIVGTFAVLQYRGIKR